MQTARQFQQPTSGDLMRPLIIAHRGDSGSAPENTMAAFERAWHLDTDFIEFDYRHSLDGIPVVIHDSTFDRTTNALQHGYVAGTRVETLPLEQLSRLDAADWPDNRWPAFGYTPI